MDNGRDRLRLFGKTDLRVSELGLGCARIGGVFQGEASGFIDLLSAALDHGINFFDTADMYSQGESEKLIGRAFKKRRDRVIIASKVGYALPAQRRLVATIKPLARPVIRMLGIKRSSLPSAVRGELSQNFTPSYMREAVEGSLRRLRTDYLDLLQLHSPPAEVIARGEWASTLEGLKRAGKIRYYGISCDTVDAADAALKFNGISSLQVVVSLLERRFAESVCPRAHKQLVPVIARECLANGLLVKAEQELDLAAYCRSPEEEVARRAELASYREQAAARGVPLAHLALSYALGVEGVGVALIGARNVEQLAATLRAYRCS